MQETLRYYSLICVLAPLVGSLIAGLLAKRIGTRGAHWATILLMAVSLFCALRLFYWLVIQHQTANLIIYSWVASGSFSFNIGFLLDSLSGYMLVVVTFVAFLVHIYSIGYMKDDPGYQRFFCYVSLFTFAMLMLVTANNFLQLFFGWEGVGLVSYLLIGFWFTKQSAADGSMKAFIVNRVGDFGFILAISAVLTYFGTIDYMPVFSHAASMATHQISIWPGTHCSVITLICILLFIGAMGKSAQIPLHVWLPESMEGPTPISALIHAATMVTAGIYMVARMSPLYELSVPAMSLVLVVGATGALFLGLLAFVEFDIKRVIAYSTMSQLGYMMAANGVSAYSAGIFHLSMHACFKALLFLSAGSVIIAMHHEQDLRKMGNLKKYIPVTYICFLVGALALSAVPPTSGFFSKDAIIEAVHMATIPGAHYAYVCLLLGAFVTGYYIFRAFFMAFHGKERMPADVRSHIKEHWVMLIPMIALAIPSLFLGWFIAKPMLYSHANWLSSSVDVLPQYNMLAKMAADFHGPWLAVKDSVTTMPFWFAIAGIVFAWLNCLVIPGFPVWLQRRFRLIHVILRGQYGFEQFNDFFIVKGTRVLSTFFYKVTDLILIDNLIVNGSGRGVNRLARLLRFFQTGYLYHYVFVMILGLLIFMIWLIH